MRLFFLLLTFCLSACGPNNESHPFVPTTPTVNPLLTYYNLNFIGTNNLTQSSGVLITGSQRVYLPNQIQGDGSGYPLSLHLFSSSFSCEYTLSGTTYTKSQSCSQYYQMLNQTIYLNGLSNNQIISLYLGI